MRSTFLAFSLFIGFAASAQQLFPPFLFSGTENDSAHTDSSRFETGVFGSYSASSNAIANEFLQRLYFGGYIDTTMKQHTYDRLQKKNRLGADVDMGAYVHWSCAKHPAVEGFAAVRDRIHVDAAFSDDLFRFVFSGNRPFAGDTMDFSNTHINSYSWKEVQGGITYRHTADDGSQVSFTGGLSFLAGTSFTQLEVPEGKLYTDSNAQYLDLITDYSLYRSDSAHTGFTAMNGYGGGGDLALQVVAPSESGKADRKILFGVYLTDLAFIRWNSNTLHYSKDTTIHFPGYEVNLNDLQDSTIGHFSSDSFTGTATKRSYTTMLPWTLAAEYGFAYKGGLEKGSMVTIGGLRMRNNANAQPDVYVRHSLLFGSHWRITAEAGFGGYTRFHAGVDVQALLGKNWMLRAGCSNLAGFISPANGGGQGAFAAAAVRF